MSEQHDDEPDELSDELADVADEALRFEGVDPDTGERVQGYISRAHLAQAMIERDER